MHIFGKLSEDMRRTRAAAVLAAVLIGLIAAAPAVAVQRKMVRDFPQNTYCPIHFGKQVEADDEGKCVSVLLTGPTRVRTDPDLPGQEALTFTATAPTTFVTFSTCSNGTVLNPGAGAKLDNFAVVRADVFRVQQIDRRDPSVPPVRRAPLGEFATGGCYQHNGTCQNLVGSVVEPALVSACGPANASCPFGDDFEDTALSHCRWRLSGNAEIDGTTKELVLARVADPDPPPPCSGAVITVDNLTPGESYILDFDWRAEEIGQGGQGLITVDIGPPPSTSFFTVPPCRVLDTRNPVGPSGGPALFTGQSRVVAIAGSCGIPPDATAVALNLTATQASTDGHLRLYPADTHLSLISALNYLAGQTRANNAVLGLSACGALAVFASHPLGTPSGTVHAIIDVTGYFR
jgi:hypothetical protein